MPQHHAMSSDHDQPIVVGKPGMSKLDVSKLDMPKLGVPECPACRRAMSVRQVLPSTSMIGVGETVYVCETCGAESHRTAKRT